jgi:hypothetical protein
VEGEEVILHERGVIYKAGDIFDVFGVYERCDRDFLVENVVGA